MSAETLYWIFSTLPQVIGAMTGLVLAATTFIYNSLDAKVRNDSTLDEFIHRAKKDIFTTASLLIWISISAIAIDIIFIWGAPDLAKLLESYKSLSCVEKGWLVVGSCIVVAVNIASFGLLIMLLHQALNPDFVSNIVSRNADEFNEKEETKLQESNSDSAKEKPVDPLVFIDHFIQFEHTVREFIPDSDSSRQPLNLRSIVNILANDNVIPREDLGFAREVINIRNIIIHEGKIDKIPAYIDKKLQELTERLESKIGKYIIKESSYRKRSVFLQWIKENVEDLSEAYELLQSIQFNERYGAYTANQEKGKTIVRGISGRTLFLNTYSDKRYFIHLLEEQYSKDGLSIEDLYHLNQSLEKDD